MDMSSDLFGSFDKIMLNHDIGVIVVVALDHGVECIISIVTENSCVV